jgi:hypothetical protein
MAETVPPLTAADLEADLLNDTFSTYFYVGAETDAGWDNALVAHSLIARLRIYLIKDPKEIAKWTGTKRPAGVVFGWVDDVQRRLNKTEAADLKTVLKAIKDARNA